jgi:hypothetical protein
VSFLKSAPLKFRPRPIKWLLTIVLVMFGTIETIRLGKNFVNVFGVVRPVGCDIQGATVVQAICDQSEKIMLHDAPFMVPLFWPGIWKVNIDSRQ